MALSMFIALFPTTALASENLYEDKLLKEGNNAIELSPSDDFGDVTQLTIGNPEITEFPDGGLGINFSLLQEVEPQEGISTQAIGWIVVGYGSLKMTLMPENGIGNFNWRMNLTNGDLIKGVRGTFVCEKNDFLNSINYAKRNVYESYSVGTLYPTASGQESFTFKESDKQQNIQIQMDELLHNWCKKCIFS